ncbi:hypothetical protein ACRB68_57450 [Actinomadura sp. RB68]|uniref:MFS transporter n=2 Tax=Actinomadura macrotermitis TaxID=2585200 RepID=A0A7K0C2J1_9ACTN|nr:hypothetical protein [Actinomadura macrotermitis]
MSVGGRVRDAVAPLRGNPRYRRYWLAGVASSAGTAMATGAVAAAVLGQGGGAGAVAMVFFGQMLAGVLVLPVAGALADRWPRVRLIVAVELTTGVLVAAQAGLIAAGHARVLYLSLIAAAVAVASAFAQPARVGLLTHLVPDRHRPQANALNRLTHYAVITAGPALGGLVVATAGPATGIGINAASFLASGLLMLRIPAPPAPAPAGFVDELAQGWRLVVCTPWIVWSLAGSTVVVSGWTVAYGIAGATYVQTRLGGPAAWGLVASGLGAGMVAGAAIALVWTPRRAAVVSNAATLPMALPGACMAAAAPLPVIVGAVAVAAAGVSVAAVAWRSLIQQRIPEHVQGRVSAWVTLGEIGVAPLSYLLVAPATAALGLRGTLAACAALIALGSTAPLLHRSIRTLRLQRNEPEPTGKVSHGAAAAGASQPSGDHARR